MRKLCKAAVFGLGVSIIWLEGTAKSTPGVWWVVGTVVLSFAIVDFSFWGKRNN